MHDLLFSSLFWHASNDIRITWISDSQCAYSVVFSIHCAQFSIIATVVMDTWHNTLFQISPRLGSCWQEWPVSLCLVWSFSKFLVPEHILSTFHNKLEPRVDRLQWLFCLPCGHHLPAWGAGHPQPRAAAKMARVRERPQMLLICIFFVSVQRLFLIPTTSKRHCSPFGVSVSSWDEK